MCDSLQGTGTSEVMETTEVPLVGFGGSWEKPALPRSLLGNTTECCCPVSPGSLAAGPCL